MDTRYMAALQLQSTPLTSTVKEMAESSDFETLSLKIIRERLAETLGQDMGPYKKQIKAVVIKAIGGE